MWFFSHPPGDPNLVLEPQYGLRKLLDMPAATPPLSDYLVASNPSSNNNMPVGYMRASDHEVVACRVQGHDVDALFESSAAALSSTLTDTGLAAVLGVGRNVVLDVGDRFPALHELFTSAPGIDWAKQVGVQATIFADKEVVDNLSDSLYEANEEIKIRLRELDVVDWASARIKLVPVDTGNPASLYNTRQALVILRDGTGVITFFRDSQLFYPDKDDEVFVGEAIFCHDPSVLPLGTPALEQLVAGRDNLMRACSRSFAADGPHAPAAPTSGEVTRSA